MIYFIFHVIPIFCTFAAAATNSKEINYDTPVKGIVNDLIENWEPPFAYLKSRGYLLEDLSSAPYLEDFQHQLQGNSGQELPFEKDSKRGLSNKESNSDSKPLRFSDGSRDDELKNMFHDLFSSKKEASEQLKSKLNVDWDMNDLKNCVQKSAAKYVKVHKVPDEQADQVEEPPLLQDPLLKEPLAQDLLVNQSPPLDHPKFSRSLPKVLKRLAKWRPKRNSKHEK